MTVLTIPIAALAFLSGVVVGIVLHYLTEYKPLTAKYDNLIQTMVGMKKQGFVPQFEFEQAKSVDVAEGVIEY
jgi:hypothetical protein